MKNWIPKLFYCNCYIQALKCLENLINERKMNFSIHFNLLNNLKSSTKASFIIQMFTKLFICSSDAEPKQAAFIDPKTLNIVFIPC